jgi:hypothetical protein
MRISKDKTTLDERPGKRRLALGRAPRTRSVVLATGMLVIGISPFAIAATGDALREGKRNGTTTSETEIIANIKSSTSLKGGYGTRQSNLSSSGGGAIYGCRSQAGGSGAKPTPQNPCVRANNLSNGLAFEFNASNGDIAGAITVGAGGDSKKPFVTNATGVATGLNADRVDGLDAKQILDIAAADATAKANSAKTRWVLIGLDGQIEAQSGGFTVVTAYPQGDPAGTGPARHNVYVNAGEDLSNNGLSATIALQNQVDQGGNAINTGTNDAPDANPEFSGEVSIAKCLTPGLVACAPPGTGSDNVLVVSPRNSDGSGTVPGERKRVYVSVTG